MYFRPGLDDFTLVSAFDGSDLFFVTNTQFSAVFGRTPSQTRGSDDLFEFGRVY